MAAAALAAPPHSKAAVTIGEDTGTPSLTTFGCSNISAVTCTFMQSAHPARVFTAPFDGVVVRWRIRGDSKTTQFTLRVISDNGDGTFTGAGTSAPQTVAPGVENSFETRLAIRQGQYIGVDILGAPGIPEINARAASNGEFPLWLPRLGDGDTRAPDDAGPNGFGLLYNADIEPDCDQDGFGDETQDPTPVCPRTLTLDANKNKVKTGKKVLFSGQLDSAQQACESDQTVDLQRKRPKQTTFATFAQLQTDPQGNFSLKQKLKKTFEFRAHVAEDDGCDDQVSDIEKVKVKRPK